MLTWVEACAFRPRESVQVAVTVTVPAASPAVLRVAEFPLPDTVPCVEVQFATDTGTLSGLVQSADTFTAPPGVNSVGLADKLIVGGFFGGSGFTVYVAEHEASFALLALGSVTCAVNVYVPGGTSVVSMLAVVSLPVTLPPLPLQA